MPEVFWVKLEVRIEEAITATKEEVLNIINVIEGNILDESQQNILTEFKDMIRKIEPNHMEEFSQDINDTFNKLTQNIQDQLFESLEQMVRTLHLCNKLSEEIRVRIGDAIYYKGKMIHVDEENTVYIDFSELGEPMVYNAKNDELRFKTIINNVITKACVNVAKQLIKENKQIFERLIV
ncbi:hypothetical protein [Ammoniphilus sp. CFH 90114]|uniref:hypothetical protein n=1 Tax=Ammoniphilus sp. CFH 90114 TaxID=2493665 RepID=UPI00100F869F|nr:hypothetical protein [Ammoniphilus sp. CFH 90114]RXT03553.1 hypothetical protein EIZ39_23770 [Ammoniphilus sp. CFH 90114]